MSWLCEVPRKQKQKSNVFMWHSAQTRSTRLSVSCGVQKEECVSGLMQTCSTLHTECVFMHKNPPTSAAPLLKHVANIQEISAGGYGRVAAFRSTARSAGRTGPYKERRRLDASQSPGCAVWRTVQAAGHTARGPVWALPGVNEGAWAFHGD